MHRGPDKRLLSLLLALTLVMSVYGGGDALAAARQLTLEAEELTARGGWPTPDRQVLSRLMDRLAESARTISGFDHGPALAATAGHEVGIITPRTAAASFYDAGRAAASRSPALPHLIDLPPPVIA